MKHLSIATLTPFAPTPRTGGAVTLYAPHTVRIEAGEDTIIEVGAIVSVPAGAVAVVAGLPAAEAPAGLTVYSGVHWPSTHFRLAVHVAAGRSLTIEAGQPIAQLIEAASDIMIDVDALADTEPETQQTLDLDNDEPSYEAHDLRTKCLRLRPGAVIPTRGSVGAAGLDLYASEPVTLYPGEVFKVPTALAIEMPAGHFGMIATRSSIALKNLTVFTTIVDLDYRGELFITVRNDRPEPYQVQAGDRLAQLVVMPYCAGQAIEAEDLSDTERGAGGYGSTGK